jgi:ABC-type Fe3+-siderophore transport system permease subunit
MKCFKHKTEAVAVCAYCGRAMCEQCVPSSSAPRMICSTECGAALAQQDRAMQSLLQKSVQTLKASAFYCYLCGGLSAAAAIVAWFLLPSTFLILFTGACAVVLFASGIWYTLVSRKQVD